MRLVSPSEMRSVIFGYRSRIRMTSGGAMSDATDGISATETGPRGSVPLARISAFACSSWRRMLSPLSNKRAPASVNRRYRGEAAARTIWRNRATCIAPAWKAIGPTRDTPEAVIRKLNSAVGKAFAEDDVVKPLECARSGYPVSPSNERQVRLRV